MVIITPVSRIKHFVNELKSEHFLRQRIAVFHLKKIANHEETQAIIRQEGGLTALLNCLNEEHDVDVDYSMFELLWTLARYPKNHSLIKSQGISLLENRLQSQYSSIQIYASKILTLLGVNHPKPRIKPLALSFLLQILISATPHCRDLAIIHLSQRLDDPDFYSELVHTKKIKFLFECFTSDYIEVKRFVEKIFSIWIKVDQTILATLGNQQELEYLFEALADPDPEIKYHVFCLLKNIFQYLSADGSIDINRVLLLMNIIRTQDSIVKKYGLILLGVLAHDRCNHTIMLQSRKLSTLIESTQSEDVFTRQYALKLTKIILGLNVNHPSLFQDVCLMIILLEALESANDMEKMHYLCRLHTMMANTYYHPIFIKCGGLIILMEYLISAPIEIRQLAAIVINELSASLMGILGLLKVPEISAALKSGMNSIDFTLQRLSLHILHNISRKPMSHSIVLADEEIWMILKKYLKASNLLMQQVTLGILVQFTYNRETHSRLLAFNMIEDIHACLHSKETQLRYYALLALGHLSVDPATHHAILMEPVIIEELKRGLTGINLKIKQAAMNLLSQLAANKNNHALLCMKLDDFNKILSCLHLPDYLIQQFTLMMITHCAMNIDNHPFMLHKTSIITTLVRYVNETTDSIHIERAMIALSYLASNPNTHAIFLNMNEIINILKKGLNAYSLLTHQSVIKIVMSFVANENNSPALLEKLGVTAILKQCLNSSFSPIRHYAIKMCVNLETHGFFNTVHLKQPPNRTSSHSPLPEYFRASLKS